MVKIQERRFNAFLANCLSPNLSMAKQIVYWFAGCGNAKHQDIGYVYFMLCKETV